MVIDKFFFCEFDCYRLLISFDNSRRLISDIDFYRLATPGQYLNALGMKVFSKIASCFFIFLSGYHVSFFL